MHHTTPLQPLARLILVKTSSWLLSERDAQLVGIRFPPRDHDPAATGITYGKLLQGIMDPQLPGRAWLRRDLDVETAETALVAETDGYVSGPEAAVLIREIDAELLSAHRDHVAKGVRRHRLFIDAERFAAISGADPDAEGYWVVIDMRFAARFEQLRCHASISVWSTPPRHRRHRPDEVAAGAAARLRVPIAECKRAFEELAERAEAYLAQHLAVVHMHVFERDYTLPSFWVAVALRPARHAMDYLESGPAGGVGVDWTTDRAQELLEQHNAEDHTLTRSALNGNLLVLRRVIRTELRPGEHTGSSRSVPTYLVLPTTADPLAGSAGHRLPADELAALAEYEAAEAVLALADLEAEAANLLHLRVRDLEIWNNHLKVYNAVVERGAFLWDALSTHLMIEWGSIFERAHNAVDMLHQILQQAVADLRHIATLTHQTVNGIDQAAADLQDSYDQRIGERTRENEPGLRAALSETGQLGRAVRLGAEVLKRAEQVRTSYDDLLKAISGAFDERRVRELDGTQKASFFVGFFAALIGLVTVLDATINMKPDDSSNKMTIIGNLKYLNYIGFGLSAALGVVVVVLSIFLAVQVMRVGRLGTKRFRGLYHGHRRPWWRVIPNRGLWRFLKDTSTDHQKRMRLDYLMVPDAQWAKVWTEHDRSCAGELVAIWDAGTQLPGCERQDDYRDDIDGISKLIEQWGVHSLLLTERARVMHWFDLPNLTCLYRCCTRIKGSFLELSDLDERPQLTMVANVDIVLSLMRLGFTREQANDIDRWLTATRFDSAAAAYERVSELGLRVGMPEAERETALQTVYHQISNR